MIYTDTELCKLLPPWYREVLDYQALCQAEQPVFQDIKAQIRAVLDNFFPQTMDVSAVEQWEEMLNIRANPDAETLDFRRQRIINRISTRPPFTLPFLYNKLDELVGKGVWSVSIDYPGYTIYIERTARSMNYTLELEWTINHIKPAHMAYVSRPYIDAVVAVAERVSYIPVGWNYRLGSWKLGELPFSNDHSTQYNYKLGTWVLGDQPFVSREGEVVAKPESTPSVKPPMLADAAEAIMQNVFAVRVNGSSVITALQKSVAGSQVQIIAAASQSIADVITKEELLDGLGNVLSSADVYIPVTSAVQLIYRITVREGTNGQ